MAKKYRNRYKDTTSEKLEERRQQRLSSSVEEKPFSLEEYGKELLGKKFGRDTFEDDLKKMTETVSSISSEWQTQETMQNTRESVESMYKRIDAYKEYQQRYGGADLTELSKGYKTLLRKWDDISKTYAGFENADAFNVARTKAQMDKKFSGLTYDEVQSELKKYDKDSDEYKYLSTYTGYNDLREFDKALTGAKTNVNVTRDAINPMPKDNKLNVIEQAKMNAVKTANGSAIAYDPNKKGNQSDYLNELETLRNQYALDHKFDLYKDYMDAEDFEEASKYSEDVAGIKYSWNGISNIKDTTYAYINNPTFTQKDIFGQSWESDARRWVANEARIYDADFGDGVSSMEKKGYDKLNDEEIAVYNYIYHTEGKEKAQEYLDDMEIMLTKRVYDEATQRWEDMADSGVGTSILMSALSVPSRMVGAFTGTVDSVSDYIDGKEYNPYGFYKMPTNYANDTREYVGENIAEATEGFEIFGQNIPSFLYQTGMSVADTAVGGKMFGKGYTVLMGLSSAQSRAKELTEAGASEEEILRGSIASGLFEMAFEKMSLDNLLKVKNPDSLLKILKETAKQAGIEGSEEFFTETANIIFDDLNRGKQSDTYKMYEDYLKRGFSTEEAEKKVKQELNKQIGWAFAGGVISGTALGGTSSISQHHDLSKTGSQIRENDRVSEMMNLEGLTPEESDAYKLYSEYAKKGINADNISDARLGNLYRTSEREAYETVESKKTTTEQKVDAINRLGKLGVVTTSKTDEERAIQQRAKALNTGEVTEVTATGNSTKIEGIRIEDGKTIVRTSEGEFALGDMTFSAKDAEIVAHAEGMGEEKGNLMLSQYDGKADVDSFVKSFNLAYSYGETGMGADSVLSNKGVLTEAQASAIYKTALTNKANERQKAIDEINEKHSGNVFVEGKFNDSIIDYDGTVTDGSKVAWKSLTKTQRDAITFAKAFSKVTGVNITFIKSDVEDGKRVGKNGSYNPAKNTIEIDVYAGIVDAKTVKDSIIPTLSHEMTHWMKAKSPAMYSKIQEYALSTLAMDGNITSQDRIAYEKARMQKAHEEMDITDEMAIDEIVARTCEDMLSNSNTARKLLNQMSKKEQNSFVTKVKETFSNLMEWVNELLAKYKSNSKEAQILREYKHRLKELSKMWDKALLDAIQTNQSLQAEGITGEEVIGENILSETSAQFSIRTYENEGRDLLHKWLENSDLSKKDKKNIIEQMDYVYDVATKYAQENDLVDFSSWSDTDIIRRDDGTPILTVVVPNGEYPLNIDFSQICKKRKALNSVLNALVRSGDLDLRTLSQSDIGNINRIIKEHGFEIACALCFVDSKRYRVNEWADSFADTFNKLVKSLAKGTGYKVDEYNYTGRNVKQPEGKLLKDADDSELNFDYINEVLTKNSSGKAIYRYALAIKNNKELRSTLNSSEIISSAGLDAIKVQNELLYSLVNSHQGSAKPKLSHSENPYGYEILLDARFNAEDAYKVGGVRIQSFSDYMANMFFDYVQMIGDLSAKRLPAHAYTKEYYFAKLFGLTGIKINMSIVPKGADITDEQKARFNKMTKAMKEKDAEFKALKSHAGLDANGNYILEDETFPLDKALEIQNTEGYDANCGIIWVGVSDAHINKMLDDENVPFIIPYHKSSLNPAIARMRNIDFYNDYTKAQNTRYDSKAKKKVPASVWSFDFYADLAKTNDPRQTAENYKNECKERGYLPKFDEFADHPNYYKLLIDFRVYDAKGNYAPQGAVKMEFPSDFNEIVGESLVEAQETQSRLDADMKGLLDEIRSELKLGTQNQQEQYSDREQTITSEDTSLNQTPATFTNYEFKPTDRILDWGGGKYDTAKKAMESTYNGIKFEVVDAFNRTKSHNDRILDEYSKEKANVLTINNVLNVINSEAVIESVVEESKNYLAEDGICYIAIYEGSKDGNSKETSAGWQNNQPASWYVPFVEKHYNYVRRQGSFIIASDSEIAGRTSKISVETKATLKQNTDALKKENLNMKHSLYSDRDNVSVYDAMGETERLIDENARLKADIDTLKANISNDDVDIKRFRSLADYLKKLAGSQYNKETLGDQLKEVYNYIQTTDDLQWNTVFAKTYDVARSMMNLNPNVSNNYFKEVMANIRKDKVTLSEEQRAEVDKLFGNYGDFHRTIFGRFNVVKEGTPLSEMWKEWSEKYPAIFDANLSAKKQVEALVDIVNALKASSSMMGEYEQEEAIRHLATEIYNQFWNVASDKSDAVQKAKADHRKMMETLRKEYEQRQKEKTLHPVGETALKYEKLLRNVMQKDKAEIKRAKELGKKRLDEHKDRAERNAKIQRITKKALTLNDWLTKPSSKASVPKVMSDTVAYLVHSIDFSSKQLLGMRNGSNAGTPTKKDYSISKALEQVHNMVVNISSAQIGEDKITEIYGTFADFPVGFADDVRELSGTVNDVMRTVGDNAYVLNQMSLEELETLDKIVTIIKSTVTKMNKYLAIRHAEGVANLSQTSIADLDKYGKLEVHDGFRGKAENLVNWGNALPHFAFKRFGVGGQKVYEALQDGWDKFAFYVKKIIDYAEKTYTSDEAKEWSEMVYEFDVLEPATDEAKASKDYVPRYQKVKMSVPQIMSLYCLQKREQAKSHLFGGGMRVADIKTKKGVITQTEGAILSQSEIDTIVGSLTARQKAVADKLQEFMNTVCTDWGNEVSMIRFDFEAFGEENYFPIQSDKNNLAVNDETEQNNSLFRLLNMSFTKGLIQNANNRIVVSDIFDVFAQHSSDMAKYNAMALPVLDAFKWYNYKERIPKGETQFVTKSVKASMENAFGKDAQNYFTTFLRDINGEQSAGRDSVGGGFFTNAKIASVGFNMRVVALQPTSYVRAGAVIDPKYLAKAFGYTPKTAMAEKHCGIALWKSLGFYDINVQNGVADLIKHNQTKKDKIVEFSMKGAEMADKVTWGYLWNACELEIRDKRKDLKAGSKEFYDAIAKRLREVIYATQVVDSTMTRSHMMRSKDGKDKMLTAFASEPTLSYNMLQDCYYDLKLTQRETGSFKTAFSKHGKKMARVITAYTVTNMLCALVEAGFDAFRDDEDELTVEEFMELYWKNLASDMSILNKIPYAKELMSMLQGYSSSRTDTQWMQYMVNTLKGVGKLLDGEGNAYTTVKNALRAYSQASGLPFYNAYRDFMALLDNVEVLTAEELEEMFNDTIARMFPSLKSK